jgi:ribosomal protein S6--L-glutamate ligase
MLGNKVKKDMFLIGRIEWCAFPELNVPAIKAKIDTGAKTSAIHAFNIKPFFEGGETYVQYDIHPLQNNNKIILNCQSLVIDKRSVMSSNGHKENRYVIKTLLHLGPHEWPVELTLSNRDPLRFRLLLGLEAIRNRVIIDPALSCHQRKLIQKSALESYLTDTP